ncbi:MAG: transporter substrate-binding domain-containing protein [Pseudonocardiaceae bacterium]
MPRTARRTSGLIFTAFLGLTACQTVTPGTDSPPTSVAPAIISGPVNVGTFTDLPGFAQLTPGTNNRGGFDVELHEWLGNHVSPTFIPVPVDLTVDERIRALEEGRVKLVVATFSITDERRKSIGFAGPYMISYQGVMVRAGDDRIQTINDLAGKTVCVLSESTGLSQLKNGSLKNQISITEEKGHKGCTDRLVNHQVDAISTDAIVLEGLAHEDPRNLSVVKNLTFGAQERYGIGLPHGDIATCETMTDKLREFITSGSWNTFFDLYFPNLPPEQYKPDPYKLDPCK